jgi:protein-disulfide isomerase
MSDAQLTSPVTDNDHVAGRADAPITLVEYGDYECPFCGMAYPIVKSIQQKLEGQLRFVFRNFPLTKQHPHAQHAAEAAEAAGAQGKFWEMHDIIFEHQRALSDNALGRYAKSLGLDAERLAEDLRAGKYASRVRNDFRSGVRSGVNGTPTFFINGERYDGDWQDEQTFINALTRSAEVQHVDK